MTNEIVTLITGANQGVGFETSKELAQKGQHVLLGSRNKERGEKAVQELKKLKLNVDLIQIDVTDKTSIKQAADKINSDYGYLSVLINNAGMTNDAHQKPSLMSTDVMREEYNVNFFGLIDVTQAMLPLLREADSAKIINLSSNMGSLSLASDPKSRFYQVSSLGYQSSKAAVNFATICFSKELADTNITVNSVNPGWTATGFGGRPADALKIPGMQEVEEGAARVVAMASDPNNEVTGTFTENEGTLPW
ncbi:SDR family oxidoreductase [Secundilactobacillus malefermentans]|uniref:SDR family oxidoreductase n=1 Tax=Secundilactobacillus malefermentans TaxID=176292 RepID=UPI0011C8CB89|nr:SDR family oxidoreductase [Secundilactobacillus malefermentans]QEA31067.1 SDR family oxidoreductase [Secundilactobacillus malefermentans]